MKIIEAAKRRSLAFLAGLLICLALTVTGVHQIAVSQVFNDQAFYSVLMIFIWVVFYVLVVDPSAPEAKT